MHVKYQKVTAGFPTARGMKASPHNRRWCVYSVRSGTLDTPLAAAEIPRQLFEALLGRQRPCLHYPQIRRHRSWARDQQALLPDDGRRHHGRERAGSRLDLYDPAAKHFGSARRGESCHTSAVLRAHGYLIVSWIVLPLAFFGDVDQLRTCRGQFRWRIQTQI